MIKKKNAAGPYYNDEQNMYEKLKPVQGRLILIYYGEAQYDGTLAFILSYMRGVIPYKQKNKTYITFKEFERRIRDTTEYLAYVFNIIKTDYKLENVILAGDRAIFVDLEIMEDYTNQPERKERALNAYLRSLALSIKTF